MGRRIVVVALLVFVFLPSVVAAQQSPGYVGATVNGVTQTHSEAEPLGGTDIAQFLWYTF